MSTTGIIIGILVAAVLLVFAEMYRELHTFRVTRYQVASPKLAGEKTWVFLSDLHNQVYGVNNCRLIDAVKKRVTESDSNRWGYVSWKERTFL